MTMSNLSPEFRPWKQSFEELVEKFKKADRQAFNKPAVQEIVDEAVRRKQEALRRGKEATRNEARIANALEQSRFEANKEAELSEAARMEGMMNELARKGEWVKRQLGLW